MTPHAVADLLEPLLAFQVGVPTGTWPPGSSPRPGSSRLDAFQLLPSRLLLAANCATEARLLRAMTLHRIDPAPAVA